jgi:hypothetical protein
VGDTRSQDARAHVRMRACRQAGREEGMYDMCRAVVSLKTSVAVKTTENKGLAVLHIPRHHMLRRKTKMDIIHYSHIPALTKAYSVQTPVQPSVQKIGCKRHLSHLQDPRATLSTVRLIPPAVGFERCFQPQGGYFCNACHCSMALRAREVVASSL